MYNAWSRSTLRMPNNAEVQYISAPPFHSFSFNQALLVIAEIGAKKQGFILDVSSVEPQLAASFDVPSPSLNVIDIAWGPEGRFYLLRQSPPPLTGIEDKWQVDVFELTIEGNGSYGSIWSVTILEFFSHDEFFATSFAVQSRLGGVILGSTSGELYHRDEDGNFPRRLGRWSEESISITKVKKDRLISCISVTGRLSLALASSNPHILNLCPSEVVSTVSFSHELPTLAVGLAPSPPRVRLFEYGWESGRVVATATRELVVFGPSLVEEERWLGGVKDLDFGTGSSVACLFYGRIEPVVFHATSGRRTTSGSATQRQGQLGSPSPSLLAASPPPYQRVKLLEMGAKNHHLTWVGSSLFFVNESAEICREGFSRHAAQAALCRNDAVRFAVLGADYCSLLSLEGNPKWTRYDCPADYVSRHGPLTRIAIDDDKSRIAVAGRRGFCVFFAQTRKWKQFQSETIESKIIATGLFWIPNSTFLCIVSQVKMPNSSSINGNGSGIDWEFQIHDMAEGRLDAAPAYTSAPLGHLGAPMAVDFIRGKAKIEMVILFLQGIKVYELVSHAQTGNITMQSKLFVPRLPAADLGFVTHLVLVPSRLESVLPRCVLTDSAGRCAVLSLETQEMFSLTAASSFRVGDAWVKNDPTLGIIVWTVVDRGLKLWVPSLDPVGELFQAPIMDIPFPEVGSMPIGSDEDAFICVQAHLYDVRASKSPVLHGILGWLLRKGRDSLARRVLAERRFSKSARLVRAALEDLLQGALLGENQVEVRKVVNLLGCVPFEVMAAVVARCARQIDPALWDVLFSIVGAPRDLFEQCLVRFDAAPPGAKRNELILIAAELLPIVDADKDDPQDGPIIRAKQVLKRCERGSNLEHEVHDYADKRGLDIAQSDAGSEIDELDFASSFVHEYGENGDDVGVVSSVIKFLSGF
jgi:hypothetical protein